MSHIICMQVNKARRGERMQTSFESQPSEGDAVHRYQQLYFVFLLFMDVTCSNVVVLCLAEILNTVFKLSLTVIQTSISNSIELSELKVEFQTKVLAKCEIIHCFLAYCHY